MRIRPRFARWFLPRFLKRRLPTTLFGRSVLIIILPIAIMQVAVTWAFFDAHWRIVTSRLSEGLAGDIAWAVDSYKQDSSPASLIRIHDSAERSLDLSIVLQQGSAAKLPERRHFNLFSTIDASLDRALSDRLDDPYWFNTTTYPAYVDIRVKVKDGVLRILAPKDRAYATQGHIFVLWMVVATLILTAMSLLFIRNQVRAIERLADAAEATMARVVESVAQVTQVLGAIAHASREQSAGVQEVSQAIAQIDAATQQNAALVEEAAGAAESFQHEARQLVDVVGRFKTDRNDDRGRVIALVKAAVEHVRRHGVRRACDDLNDPRGEFVRGEDYVFALAADGTQLAFAPDRNIVGRNNVDESDPTGKVVGREILRVAADPGFGWVGYHFRHPTTGEIVPKSVYVEAVEGIILGCGIYGRAPAPAAAASAPVAGRLGGGTFGPARMHEEGLRKAASRVPLALTRAAPP